MAADREPMVSVIVPVRDGLAGLIACVTRLLDQDYPADCYEVIVVDNGSAHSPNDDLPTDDRLLVLAEPRPGSYAARNTGVKAAKGEVLAFTDADCLPERDWLSQAVTALQVAPDIAMVGGRVDITFAHGRPRSGAEWYEFANGFPQEAYISKGGFAVTANMACWRRVFDEVGEFDANLRSGGDGEWGRRVRAAGGRQEYAAGAAVLHPARVSWSELSSKHRRTTLGVIDRLPRSQVRKQAARLAVAQFVHAARDTARGVRTTQPQGAGRQAGYLAALWWVAGVNARALGAAALKGPRVAGETGD